MNENDVNPNQNPTTPEINILKLALISSAIVTLGDAIGTIAAALELEETVNSDNQAQQSQRNLEKQMIKMQKQIDYLTNRVNKLTR